MLLYLIRLDFSYLLETDFILLIHFRLVSPLLSWYSLENRVSHDLC